MRTTLVSSRNRENKLGSSGLIEGERDRRCNQEGEQRPGQAEFRVCSEDKGRLECLCSISFFSKCSMRKKAKVQFFIFIFLRATGTQKH